MQPISVSSADVARLRALREQAENLPEADGPQERIAIQIRRDPWKRGFDVAFSALCLLVFSPLLLLLSLLVALTSRGPVFYKSRRLGRGGKIIECIKFRTMYKDAELRLHQLLNTDAAFRAEWEKFQKVRLDPRITPVGRFLRRTSLDEFPQFWNVLKGDLSVVGPRPPTLLGAPEQFLKEIKALYGARTATILSIRPGITGVWQISGRSRIPFETRCELEETYALHRTFWQDLKLIFKTVPAVLFSRGAF